MPSIKQTIFSLNFIFIFTACSINTQSKPMPPITTVEPIIIEEKPTIKKPVKKIKKKPIVKKKKYTYKYCSKHIKIMNHASAYINNEFENAYFSQKDIVGAKAQLFLVQSKSQSVFAKSINAANESYKKQYNLASKYKCNVKKYKTTPLQKIQYKIKTLEKGVK